MKIPIKPLLGLAIGFFTLGVGLKSNAIESSPHQETGRVISIDCNDREATIETTDCQRLRVGFASREACQRHHFGDVIQVSGEKRGSEMAAEQVSNLGLPRSLSGTITSISCVDGSMEVESCGQKCRVAISPESCRPFKYGDKVEIQGSEANRNTGCVGLAESIQKQSFKSKKMKKPLFKKKGKYLKK